MEFQQNIFTFSQLFEKFDMKGREVLIDAWSVHLTATNGERQKPQLIAQEF